MSAISLVVTGLLAAATPADPPKRPNVLLVLADDMGFSDLGCFGGEIDTPNLDALARNGLRFTRFYNTARCWPTRGSILTGYYAQQIRRDTVPGMPSGNRGTRPAWAKLLPDLLAPLGYHSYHSGKWHIDGLPLKNGFEHSYSLNDHDRHFAPKAHTRDDKPLPAADPASGYYSSTAIADAAIGQLKGHFDKHADAPFFSFVAFTAPHFPVQAPAADVAKYRGKYLAGWDELRQGRWKRMADLRLGDNLPAIEREVGPPYAFPDAIKKLGPNEVNRPLAWADLTPEQKAFQADKMAVHAAMVDRMDREIGRILDTLKKAGRLDNTLVLFLSDNGASAEMMVRGDGHDPHAECGTGATFLSIGPGWSSLCNTPFRRHKTWVHEGGIHTPLVVHWPNGIKAKGELRGTPGHVADVVPTVLELATSKAAARPDTPGAPPFAGRSLVPALAGDLAVTRDSIWWQHEGNRALRVGDWKVVAAGKDSAWELYDLAADPTESKNLAAEKPEKVRELAEAWQRQTEAHAALARRDTAPPPAKEKRPNVIFILSDDMAQGDVGCYGQKLIRTPTLDAMAKEGTRFTQAYCGTSVCAPSRTSLMIGRHTGHSPIRANREIQPEGQKPLPADTYTVARLFKDNGYATACVGKWGMGMFDTTGSPLKVGFDHFFGYNCQRHAHSYFPTYLYRDDKRFELAGNDGKGVGKTYAQNLIADETLAWVTANKDRPIFLFYSVTLPHGRHEIDDQGRYKAEPWTEPQKNYAAQVTRLDSDVGRLLARLKELGLDDQTLVIVAGDNGSSFDPASEIGKRFDQTMGGKLRGYKRTLYEGGLRQACIARWPGTVPAGRVCDDPWAFWDFLPTCADLLGAKLPAGVPTDGVSVLPMLKGGPAPARESFYWELHENGSASLQAVRFGNWKAVKNGPSAKVQLYDLAADPGEKTDLAGDHPAEVAQAVRLLTASHEPHPDWPLRESPKRKK